MSPMQAVMDRHHLGAEQQSTQPQQTGGQQARCRQVMEGRHPVVLEHTGPLIAGMTPMIEAHQFVDQCGDIQVIRRQDAGLLPARDAPVRHAEFPLPRPGQHRVDPGMAGQGEDRADAGLGQRLAAALRTGQVPGRCRRGEFGNLPLAPGRHLRETAAESHSGVADIRIDQHVEIVADADAERQQAPSRFRNLEIKRRQPDQATGLPDRHDTKLSRLEYLPPGQQPGRRLEWRGLGAAPPQAPPFGLERREHGRIVRRGDVEGRNHVTSPPRCGKAAPGRHTRPDTARSWPPR